MATNDNTLVKTITTYIETGIKAEAAKVAASYKEQMLKDLDGAIDAVVAKTALRLSKQMSIQDLSDRLVIEIRKEP